MTFPKVLYPFDTNQYISVSVSLTTASIFQNKSMLLLSVQILLILPDLMQYTVPTCALVGPEERNVFFPVLRAQARFYEGVFIIHSGPG